MAAAYTADDLLDRVRRGGSLPTATSTGNLDADLLAHADDELRDTLVPLMLGVQEEFYQRAFDVSVTSGTAGYRINKRAALSRINTVAWVNSDGSGYELVRLDPKRVTEMGTVGSGQPSAYYLEGSRVTLWPTPSGSGTLRIRAFVRPSRLCLIADSLTGASAISAVSVGASVTTLTVAVDVVSSTVVRDVVASTPSFEHLAVDATATRTAATTVTIPNSSFTTTPIVGDSLCVSDLSPYIQLPVELHPALIELVVARVLRAKGKLSEAKQHADEAERLVSIGIAALTPRVDSADRKIVGGPHWRRGRFALTAGR